MDDSLIQWGMIPNNRWGAVEGAVYGNGVIRTVPNLRYLSNVASRATGDTSNGQCKWIERDDGSFVMDLGIRQFDAAHVQSLEQVVASLRASPPRLPERDKRVESLSFMIDKLLQKLQSLADAKQPAGLVTPRNVILVTRAQEDYLGASQLRAAIASGKKRLHALTSAQQDLLRRTESARSVVLPDAGFQFPLPSSSVPSWLDEPHEFAFLWDRPAVDEHLAPVTPGSAIRSTARLTGWALAGAISDGEIRSFGSEQADHGAVWSVLARALDDDYATVADFRAELSNSPLTTHRFDRSRNAASKPSPAQTPPSSPLLRRLGIALLLTLLLSSLVLGAWIWKDWPRPVLNGLPRRTVTGSSVTADIRESAGQTLAIRWGSDSAWQEVSGNQDFVRSHSLDHEGEYEITLTASSKLLGVIPVSRETRSRLTVEDALKAINTPLSDGHGQYLRVESSPSDATVPNKLLIRLELPDDRSIDGLVSIGAFSSPIGVGRPVSYRVTSPGAYRIDWIPDENPFGVHGEFVRMRFLAPSEPPEKPVASFQLTPNPAVQGEVVSMDPSKSSASPGNKIVGLDVDWGEGEGWERVVVQSEDLHHTYPRAGQYDVRLRVNDNLGAVAEATRPLLVEAPPAVIPPEDPPVVETVNPGSEDFRRLDDDIQKSVVDAGGASGTLQVSLRWWNENDLDLVVKTAEQETIYWDNPASSCGGRLDVDMNVEPETKTPVENIVWRDGAYPKGPIRVFVCHFKNHELPGCEDPTAFVVRVKVRDNPPQLYRGAVTYHSGRERVFVVEVKP